MAIDQREMAEVIDEATGEILTTAPQSEPETDDAVILDDPIPPDAPARQAPITQAELRQRALANIIPSWTAARIRVSGVKSRLEGVKGELKYATADLERHETVLEHVGNCRQEPCLRCQEIAINPSRRAEETAQEDEDEETYDVTDAIIDESRGGLDESDAEPIADADRVAEQEAVQADAEDQVESVSLEPDQRQALEEIAAARETAEVAG